MCKASSSQKEKQCFSIYSPLLTYPQGDFIKLPSPYSLQEQHECISLYSSQQVLLGITLILFEKLLFQQLYLENLHAMGWEVSHLLLSRFSGSNISLHLFPYIPCGCIFYQNVFLSLLYFPYSVYQNNLPY